MFPVHSADEIHSDNDPPPYRKLNELNDTPIEWLDPTWRIPYIKRIKQLLNNRGLNDFSYASMKIHLYVVREGTQQSNDNQINNEILKVMYKGWSPISINPILIQVGLWVREVVICEIVAPIDERESGFFKSKYRGDPHYDNWVYRAGGNDYKLRIASGATTEYGCDIQNDGSTDYTIAEAGAFRVLWSGFGTYSVATYGTLVNRMTRRHGRNIIVHEMGHNFGLPHSNEAPDFPCSGSPSPGRIMYNTIFNDSYQFSPCEVGVVQTNIKCYIDNNPSCNAALPETLRWENPTSSNLALGEKWLGSTFQPVGCTFGAYWDPETRLPVFPRTREFPFFSQHVWDNVLPDRLKKREEYEERGVDLRDFLDYYEANDPRALPPNYCDSYFTKDFSIARNRNLEWRYDSYNYLLSIVGNLSFSRLVFCKASGDYFSSDRINERCYLINSFGILNQTPSHPKCTKRLVDRLLEVNGLDLIFNETTNCNVKNPN